MSEVNQDAPGDAELVSSTGRNPTHDFGFLPIPKRLRYDPERPVELVLVLNMIFGASSTFSKYCPRMCQSRRSCTRSCCQPVLCTYRYLNCCTATKISHPSVPAITQ